MRPHWLVGVVVSALASTVVMAQPWGGAATVSVAAGSVVLMAGEQAVEIPDSESEWHALLISSSVGGSVTSPGEGKFAYPYGAVIGLEAVADAGYHFTGWSGTLWSTLNPTVVVMTADYEITANFARSDPVAQPGMGMSLGEIDVNEAGRFSEQVQGNNFVHAANPRYNRVHIARVADLEPDPAGMMRMQNLRDGDPAAGQYGAIVSARAKGAFEACDGARVLVRFSYLFSGPARGLGLVAFLSDVPALLERDDPSRGRHYVEVGRIVLTPQDRPGSLGSGRFGVFEQWVSTAGLDLSRGTWVELELMQEATGSASGGSGTLAVAAVDRGEGSALIDDWAVEVHCDGICLDLNWSDTADEEDFLLVVASCGRSAGLLEGGVGSRYCLDGAFSSDGYVDTYDLSSWDWALRDSSRVACNFCRVPLPLDEGGAPAGGGSSFSATAPEPGVQIAAGGSVPGGLLISGKGWVQTSFSDLLKDRFCLFNEAGQYAAEYVAAGLPNRCNIRVVSDPQGHLYVVNSERGILQIDGQVKEIVAPGKVQYSSEPRYHTPATVYVGIQGQGSESFGRPMLDAAFDAGGSAYVVPVVVQPARAEAYVAAAKLELRTGAQPPYRVLRIYDDAPPAGDNQQRDALREIELDREGNVYLLNVHQRNESDILWKCSNDGTLRQRRGLTTPDAGMPIPDPTALHISGDGKTVFLASGQTDPQDSDSTMLYSVSAGDLSVVGSVLVRGMQQITAVTQDPTTNAVWAVGFHMPEVPEYPSPLGEPFYVPMLAEVTPQARGVQAVPLPGQDQHNLALPMSIIWIGDQ